MLEILYCEEEIFDLPPPTLFYRSDKSGFEQLRDLIASMINGQRELCLNGYDFIRITGTLKKIVFKPFSNRLLLKITDTEIITDISIEDWKTWIDKIIILINSKNSLTYFIEFEDYFEEGNIVIES